MEIARLVKILADYGLMNGYFTDKLNPILYLLPGNDDYTLGFRWVNDAHFGSDAIEITLSQCWGGLIMAQWRVDLLLLGLVLRQTQMFVAELESLDEVE
ncbi:hypothetical protein A4S05_10230 [Nostoc sp. KVJ20]|uniref:hypothetical protein n=1 Tax=Nostoc sp. KVJ20 TaxID=457944 RepID=UPI00083E3745|nr:hypothetical protein [Nostoc sp. KVJ20]ODG98210.1 hypothetical protein A4S05_10230 [Nostoc sp. KVJ20]